MSIDERQVCFFGGQIKGASSMKKLSLITKIFICLVLGISIGLLCGANNIQFPVKILATFTEKCPQCGVPASKFKKQEEGMTWAAEHVVGVAKGVSEDILEDLRANFNGECSEVGMYLAMARVAHREGYPEIGLYWEKAAYEEAEHAAKFAELLGEVVTDSTKKNLELRVAAEHGATEGKFDLAKRAKAANLDAIHDTVHEMAKDEARHGKAFEGLLKRYFG